MAKNTKNAVKNDDGTNYELGDTAGSIVEYNIRFAGLGERPRSGYDKYFNDHGFTNPQSPKGLSPQGIGKLMAQLFEKAHETIRSGGTDATEMSKVLTGILAYNEIAGAEVAKNAEKQVMAEALKVVGPEKLAAFVAEVTEVTEVVTPTEVTPEPTVTSPEVPTEAVTETAVELPAVTIEPTEPKASTEPIIETTESETVTPIESATTEQTAETPAVVVNQTEQTTGPVAVDEVQKV